MLQISSSKFIIVFLNLLFQILKLIHQYSRLLKVCFPIRILKFIFFHQSEFLPRTKSPASSECVQVLKTLGYIWVFKGCSEAQISFIFSILAFSLRLFHLRKRRFCFSTVHSKRLAFINVRQKFVDWNLVFAILAFHLAWVLNDLEWDSMKHRISIVLILAVLQFSIQLCDFIILVSELSKNLFLCFLFDPNFRLLHLKSMFQFLNSCFIGIYFTLNKLLRLLRVYF